MDWFKSEEKEEVKPETITLKRFTPSTKISDSEDLGFGEKISSIVAEIRGNEMKIVEDFLRAFTCSEMLTSGKDLLTLMKNIELNVMHDYACGGSRYWISVKDNTDCYYRLDQLRGEYLKLSMKLESIEKFIADEGMDLMLKSYMNDAPGEDE